MDCIEVKDLKKRIPRIDIPAFHIAQGEFVGLVGANGAGKTTLAKLLLRLLRADEGVIYYQGRNLAEYSSNELVSFRRSAQIIFQDPSLTLNPKMTVDSILTEPLKIHGLDISIQSLLDRVHLPSSFLKKRPHQLSGGEKQRVVIARTLALDPEFLICDEPVKGLDDTLRDEFIQILSEWNGTLLLISHDLELINTLCPRVVEMHDGSLVSR